MADAECSDVIDTPDLSIVSDEAGSPSATRFVGIVKFFEDKKKGFGFVKEVFAKDGEEFFVHISDLRFLYGAPFKAALYTGEYVSFTPGPPNAGGQRRRAFDVRGVGGGPLQCEHGEMQFRQYRKFL